MQQKKATQASRRGGCFSSKRARSSRTVTRGGCFKMDDHCVGVTCVHLLSVAYTYTAPATSKDPTTFLNLRRCAEQPSQAHTQARTQRCNRRNDFVSGAQLEREHRYVRAHIVDGVQQAARGVRPRTQLCVAAFFSRCRPPLYDACGPGVPCSFITYTFLLSFTLWATEKSAHEK